MFSASADAHDIAPKGVNPFVGGQTVETTVVMDKARAGFQMYYQDLGAFISQPGETKEAFMGRVASFLAYYTKVKGWEACGMVQEAHNGQGWGVRLITNGSQLGCARIQFEMAGSTSTDESIHSHPTEGSAQVGPISPSVPMIFPTSIVAPAPAIWLPLPSCSVVLACFIKTGARPCW